MSDPLRYYQFYILIYLSLLLVANPAHGEWQPGYQAAGFLDGPAYCAVAFDGMLAIGGAFNGAGCVRSPGVVLTDFQQFYPTGHELWSSQREPYGAVHALAVYDGNLVAAGEFRGWTGIPISNVARWTGTEWVSLGGPYGSGPLYGGPVFGLAVFEGDLIAVGHFTDSKYASGLQGIARYDGSQWQSMGVRPPGARAMAVWNGELYCGLSKWDGSVWQPIGAFTPEGAKVMALDVVDDGLAIGGTFERIDGELSFGTALYDGQSIQSFGDGSSTTDDPGFGPPFPGGVGGFASFAGETYMIAPNYRPIPGYFGLARLYRPEGFDVEYWVPANNLTWQNGLNSAGDIVVMGDRLVALLGSKRYLADIDSAGALDAVVLQDGDWSPLIPGLGWPSVPTKVTSKDQRNWLALNDQGLVLQKGPNYFRVESYPVVNSLGTLPNGVFAAGSVHVWGHVSHEYPILFEFDANGQTLGVFRGDGSIHGYPSVVGFSIATSWESGYLVGSAFSPTWYGDPLSQRIEFLSGTDASDLQPLPGISTLTDPIDDLVIHQGRPWYSASGELVRIDGSLDNLMTASLMGTFNRNIHALVSDGHSLIVGGEFDSVNALHTPHLAIWDGTSWLASPDLDGPVYALAVDGDGVVFLGGDFNHFAGAPTSYLAVLHGRNIGMFFDGPNGPVTDVAITESGILVTGDFSEAGGQCAMHVAEWVGQGTALSNSQPHRPDEKEVPSIVTRLHTPAPNPFNPRVMISFDLPRRGVVQLRVFDPAGRLVRTLVAESLETGFHKFVWDGTDDRGAGVASGMYFASLEANGRRHRQKMTLVR